MYQVKLKNKDSLSIHSISWNRSARFEPKFTMLNNRRFRGTSISLSISFIHKYIRAYLGMNTRLSDRSYSWQLHRYASINIIHCVLSLTVKRTKLNVTLQNFSLQYIKLWYLKHFLEYIRSLINDYSYSIPFFTIVENYFIIFNMYI